MNDFFFYLSSYCFVSYTGHSLGSGVFLQRYRRCSLQPQLPGLAWAKNIFTIYDSVSWISRSNYIQVVAHLVFFCFFFLKERVLKDVWDGPTKKKSGDTRTWKARTRPKRKLMKEKICQGKHRDRLWINKFPGSINAYICYGEGAREEKKGKGCNWCDRRKRIIDVIYILLSLQMLIQRAGCGEYPGCCG